MPPHQGCLERRATQAISNRSPDFLESCTVQDPAGGLDRQDDVHVNHSVGHQGEVQRLKKMLLWFNGPGLPSKTIPGYKTRSCRLNGLLISSSKMC